MSLPLNPNLAATIEPAVTEAFRWLAEARFTKDKPLIAGSQAAPQQPPPEAMRRAMAEMLLTDPAAHFYNPNLGFPELREALAARTCAIYGGEVGAGQVAITSGCNHAFACAVATLAQAGDEVILPVPWFFNHAMWLDMQGITPVPLPTGADLLPDPEIAAALITARTRAIVVVTPNNPAGVEYSAGHLRALYDLAQRHGLALIVDETYRDFHSARAAPHDLFTDPDWPGTLIHLYSFSKAYRLTGHRVGALIGAADRMTQVEKYVDSLTICPPALGQKAALWGIRNLDQWLSGERAEILDRRAAITAMFDALPGWTLKGAGGFFAYVEHPFDNSSDQVARRLLFDQAALSLPATFFAPEHDANAKRHIRFAFANIDRAGIAALQTRLQNLAL